MLPETIDLSFLLMWAMSTSSKSPALEFEIIAKCSVSLFGSWYLLQQKYDVSNTDHLYLKKTTKARASILTLPHGPVLLPMFMPVATQASLKGLTPKQLARTGCNLCLNNTYHLGLKPGQDVLEKLGGAHVLQGWNGNILTDSGGWVFKMHSNSDRLNSSPWMDGLHFRI